jgi:hypothetical protein
VASDSWWQARWLCGRLDGDAEPDCLVAAMEAQGRLEASDCQVVPEGLWRDECVFLYAERQARAGDLGEAMHTCEQTRFGRECSFHLIREGSRAVLDKPVAEAAAATGAYTGMKLAPDAERLFWKSWFRERLQKKKEVDPRDCPTASCFEGAREAVLSSLNGLARAGALDPCTGPLPDGTSNGRRLWVDHPIVWPWVMEFVEGECARREGRVRVGPAGLPQAPQGGIPAGAKPGG